MKIIDLTHTFAGNMPVFPGDPESTLTQTAFINKDTYTDHKLITQMHVGTHMDGPLHMIANGKRIDELLLDTFMGKGILINAVGKKEIDTEVLENIKIDEGSIVLIRTDFSKKYFEESYFRDSPILTSEFAKLLVSKKIKLIGLDFAGPDTDSSWPVHKILLGAEIPIIENLTNLEELENKKEFEVIALPLNISADASLVRVIVKINI